MHSRIIIADTSCLIALEKIEQLDLLGKIYQSVTVTPEVVDEFGSDLPHWFKIEEVKDKQKIALLELELDKGESSAIALAMEKENSLLIIDEKKGRTIAKKMGIAIIGLLGIIVKAKKLRLISQIKPLLDKLDEVDFRISKRLKLDILRQENEI